MAESDALEQATSRLTTALKVFEETISQKRHADLTAEALQEQIETLTASLGAERKKTERLLTANDTVSERLDAIIDSVRTIVEAR